MGADLMRGLSEDVVVFSADTVLYSSWRSEPLANLLTPDSSSSFKCMNEHMIIHSGVLIYDLSSAIIAAWLNPSQISRSDIRLNRYASIKV